MGKLETKIARNYVYEHSESKHRNNNADEPIERMYKGTPEEVEKAVLSKIKGTRTGTIPEYPQGLVIHDRRSCGFFDLVTYFDETFICNFNVMF